MQTLYLEQHRTDGKVRYKVTKTINTTDPKIGDWLNLLAVKDLCDQVAAWKVIIK